MSIVGFQGLGFQGSEVQGLMFNGCELRAPCDD